MFRRSHKSNEELSAYIDSRLSERERLVIEAHLEACAACRRQLAKMQATVDALKSLREEEAPRSFVLSPGQVMREARPPIVPAANLGMPMRLATAALSLALAVVLTADLANFGGDGDESQTRSAAETMAATAEDSDAEAPAAADSAEPERSGGDDATTEESAPEGTSAPEAGDASDFGSEEDLEVEENAAQDDLAPAESGDQAEADSEDGGVDALRIAEIALAVALGVSIVAVIAIWLSKRRAT